MNRKWPTQKLEDLAADIPYPIGDGDHGQIKPSFYTDSGIPYIRVGDIGWGVFKPDNIVFISKEVHEINLKSELRPGDILLAKTGATIGKCCIVPDSITRANTTSSVGKVTVDKNKVLPQWVLYWFLSPAFFRFMWSISKRAAQPGFNNRDIKLFEIPLPPLAEQRRIVGLLDEAFEGLATAKANAEKNLQNARALFESGLDSAVTGKLTHKWRRGHLKAEPGSAIIPRILHERRHRWEQQRLESYQSKGIAPPKDWKKKYELPAEVDKRYLPNLPSNWAVVSVSEATHRLTYGITVRPKYVDDGIPIISGREIRSGEIDLDIANRISQHDYDGLRAKCRLQMNDVLFGKTGTIGSVARVKTDKPLCVSQNVALLSPLIQPEYFEIVMRSGIIQGMAKEAIINAAIPDLQLRFLEKFPIPIPPEEEQAVIVKKFHVLREETQRLARIYERKLAALAELKKSLLHQAFTGEL